MSPNRNFEMPHSMLEVILDPTVREKFQASLLGFLGSRLGDLALSEVTELPGMDVVSRYSRRGVQHGVLALRFAEPEKYAQEVAMLSGGFQATNGKTGIRNLGVVLDLNELEMVSRSLRSDIFASTAGAAASRLLSGLVVINLPKRASAPAQLMNPMQDAGFGGPDLIVVPSSYQDNPALGSIAANQLLQSGLK